jgi:hypothetical protein
MQVGLPTKAAGFSSHRALVFVVRKDDPASGYLLDLAIEVSGEPPHQAKTAPHDESPRIYPSVDPFDLPRLTIQPAKGAARTSTTTRSVNTGFSRTQYTSSKSR